MFIKCTEKDQTKLLAFLKEEASLNTFIIGDILAYGFSCDDQSIYIIEDDEIKCVALVYFSTLLIYQKNTEIYPLEELIEKHTAIYTVLGKYDILKLYEASFSHLTLLRKTFMELRSQDLLLLDDHLAIKQATKADAPFISAFYQTIKEFVQQYNGYDEVLKMIETRITKKEGRHYFICDKKDVIAHVNSAAENPYSAIIGGVATKISCRQRGYATKIVSNLCADLLNENKIPCLFYDNEEAGKLYKKIGFKETAKWGMMLYLNK